MITIEQARGIVPPEDYTDVVYPEVTKDQLKAGNIVFSRTSGDLRGLLVFKYTCFVFHKDAGVKSMYAVPLTEPLLLRCGFEMDPTLDRYSNVYRKKQLRYSPDFGWFNGSNKVAPQPRYLHELQNEYYKIYNEELL